MRNIRRAQGAVCLLLAVCLLAGSAGWARAEAPKRSFSFGGTKAPEEETPVSMSDPLSITESVVPFHRVKWGMAYDDVMAEVHGKAMKNKQDIQIYVSIPGIDQPQLATYHCEKTGLEKVTVLIDAKVNTAVKYRETAEGKAIYDLADKFLLKLDASERYIINGGNYTSLFRSSKTDIMAGYIPVKDSYDLMLVFYRPVVFDQQQLVSSKRFYKTTEGNGDLLYFTQTTQKDCFDTPYSRSKRQDRSLNMIASKIRMQGSNVNKTYAVPSYGIVYAYAGTVKPDNINAIIFTINDTIYQFSQIYKTSTSVTRYNEYSTQFTIWLGKDGDLFMNALEKAKGTIAIEIRGTGFNLRFNLPSGVKTLLLADWAAYKKANGNHPFFTDGLSAISSEITIF